MEHPAIPIPATHTMLTQANTMRRIMDDLLGPELTPRAKMILHYHDLEDMALKGALVAIDLGIDLAFLIPADPRLAGQIPLDDDALRARIRDMIAMRSAKLN